MRTFIACVYTFLIFSVLCNWSEKTCSPQSYFFLISFNALPAASFPVMTEISSPEGLKLHCPAWLMWGSGVMKDLVIFFVEWITGTSPSVNALPVIAPSLLLVSFSMGERCWVVDSIQYIHIGGDSPNLFHEGCYVTLAVWIKIFQHTLVSSKAFFALDNDFLFTAYRG